MSKHDSFFDKATLQKLLGDVAHSYPNLAQRLSMLYNSIDIVASDFGLKFDVGDIEHEIEVRAVEPLVRRDGDITIIGANIYLGIRSEYVADFINAGQILILVKQNGSLEYETFVYKSVNSVIISDSELKELAKWLRVVEHRFKIAIETKLIGIADRTISRKRTQQEVTEPPQDDLEEIPEEVEVPEMYDRFEGEKTDTKKEKLKLRVTKSEPIKKPVKIEIKEQPKKVDDDEEGQLDEVVKANIPPLTFKSEGSKVKIPPDLKLTKKEREG